MLFLDNDAEIVVRKLADLQAELPSLNDICIFFSYTSYTMYKLRSYLPHAVVGLAYRDQFNQYNLDGSRKHDNPFWHQVALVSILFCIFV